MLYFGLQHPAIGSWATRRGSHASLHAHSVQGAQPPTRITRCEALSGLGKLFGGSSPAAAAAVPQFDPHAPELEPEFRAWLRQGGLSTEPLLLRQCGRAGRGLVASRHVARGETVVQVPDALLLTAERAAEESCLAPLLRTLPTPPGANSTTPLNSSSSSASSFAASSSSPPPPSLPEWSLLALFLAEQRCRLAARDHSSRWAPYVAVLPRRPGTVLDWPAKELKQLLRGSPLYRLADSITAAAAASRQELEPIIEKGRADGLVPPGLALGKADLDWAFGMLLSRCIRLPGRGDLQVLAPWADLLNHDVAAEAGCHLDWDAVAGRAGALVLRADRPYAAGQQAYVSYGPKSSGELLLSYGFCPPPTANPHTDYKLRLAVDPATDPLADLKVAALARHGLPPELEFPLRLEGLPEGLLQYLALIEARPKVAQETYDLASMLFEGGSFPLLDGEDTLAAALRGLSGRCAAALKDYPTTMEDDRPTAELLTGGDEAASSFSSFASASSASSSLQTLGTEEVAVSSVRAAAVASIRVRERLILQRTQAAAADQLLGLKRAAARARLR